jgi:hypothetical protein
MPDEGSYPDGDALIPERFDEHVNLLYDLQWLAFRADIEQTAFKCQCNSQSRKNIRGCPNSRFT